MRNRAELLICTSDGFIVEKLLDTAHPQNVGKLRCPGGKMERSESAKTTLVREMWEEYDVHLDESALIYDSVKVGPSGLVTRYQIHTDAFKEHRISNDGCEQLVHSNDVPEYWV